MQEVTQLLQQLGNGDQQASARLLPLIYDQLRQLAAWKLSHEPAGQTLQPTALVHEAYLRLVGDESSEPGNQPRWDHRGHFFAAAAEAMRRILIENARRKLRVKHGGEMDRVELSQEVACSEKDPQRLLELDAALGRLVEEDPRAAQVVTLHFFGGQSLDDVAVILDISRASAYRQWAYARSWLKAAMEE